MIPVFLLISGSVLLANLVTATATRTETTAAAQCIRCHVRLFDVGQRQPFTHVPFFEHRCTVCHLAPGVAAADIVAPEDRLLTGSVVDQRPLWRKQQRFAAAAGRSRDHLVGIPALKPDAAFRFRILTGAATADNGGEGRPGLWLGLRPAELPEFGTAQQLDFNVGPAADSFAPVRSAALYRSGGTVFIAWETAEPTSGWVEVQELEGLDPEAVGPATRDAQAEAVSGHPPLRTAEETAIDACYQCHPESGLGTSHPVRLYGGDDVRIPDDLPTVDGMMTCVTCHDPHGAEVEMLVRETVKTKLCVACHYKYKNSSPNTMFR